jgi:hypothetical protein
MAETYQVAYEGGFQGMKASDEATLDLSDAQFVLKRPRVFLSRSLHKIWAKWSAVTALVVKPTDGGGSRFEVTTKARGTGIMVLEKVAPDELWGVLDGIGDLKERFHREGAVPSDQDAEADEGAEGDDAEGDDAEK